VFCPQLRGHAPSNWKTPDRHNRSRSVTCPLLIARSTFMLSRFMSSRGREKTRGRSPVVRSEISSPKMHERGVHRGQHDVARCTSRHVLAGGWASTGPIWESGQGGRIATCAAASHPSSDTNFAHSGWRGPSRCPFLEGGRGGHIATGAAASAPPLAASISQLGGRGRPPEVRFGGWARRPRRHGSCGPPIHLAAPMLQVGGGGCPPGVRFGVLGEDASSPRVLWPPSPSSGTNFSRRGW